LEGKQESKVTFNKNSELSSVPTDVSISVKEAKISKTCPKDSEHLQHLGIAGGEVLWKCPKCESEYWGSSEGVFQEVKA
jgi:hypothetical protein